MVQDGYPGVCSLRRQREGGIAVDTGNACLETSTPKGVGGAMYIVERAKEIETAYNHTGYSNREKINMIRNAQVRFNDEIEMMIAEIIANEINTVSSDSL